MALPRNYGSLAPNRLAKFQYWLKLCLGTFARIFCGYSIPYHSFATGFFHLKHPLKSKNPTAK
jgi:hypothetical protein